MPVDPSPFRRAMSRFATGVAVATVRSGDRRHGMTVNSFPSVSLVPPLVLWCAEAGSRTLRLVQEAGVYAISVLSENQAQVSQHFAARATEGRDRFEGVAWSPGPATGCPLLEGALATFECRLVSDVAAGDHRVLVGEVLAAEAGEPGYPLLYFASRYCNLTDRELDLSELPRRPRDDWQRGG